jgi:ADP-heptose:LPS heptosyltransferase
MRNCITTGNGGVPVDEAVPPPESAGMKILFVTSTRIGDAVMSTGLLSHLASAYPGARFTIACGPLPAPLFAAVPGVDRVIAMDKKPLGRHWLALWATTVTEFWDLVVDLRGSALGWLLPARSRKVLRSPRDNRTHRARELGALFGLETPPAPHIWHTPEALADAARLIPGGGPVLGLGPTANWAPKIWPADRFAALADRLTAPEGILPGARIAVFGGPGEAAVARPLLDALPAERTIDLVGRLGLPGAAACLARCAFYIGNDSGLMHLAAACGTPTLGLFGPSPPARYAPWGDHAAFVDTETPFESLVGAPGFDHRRSDNLMQSLSVERVEAAARALRRRGQAT